MPFLPLILADDDADTALKILFGVVAVMIWIIKVVISSVSANKKQADARRRQIARPRPGYGGATPQQRPARVPPPTVPVFNQRVPQRNRPAQRRQPLAVAVPLPAQIIEQPSPAPPRRPAQAPARVAARPSADASRVARLLRRPDSLRAALILGEVLAPPVALRNVPASLPSPSTS